MLRWVWRWLLSRKVQRTLRAELSAANDNPAPPDYSDWIEA